MSTFNPDDVAEDLFGKDADKAEIAAQNADALKEALQVLDRWRTFMEKAVRKDKSKDEEKLTEAMEAIEEAHEAVSELYPILAVQAGMIKLSDRKDDGGDDLDPSNDRTFA